MLEFESVLISSSPVLNTTDSTPVGWYACSITSHVITIGLPSHSLIFSMAASISEEYVTRNVVSLRACMPLGVT